jgi:hypothetical protein
MHVCLHILILISIYNKLNLQISNICVMNSFLYIILCPFTNVTFSHAVEGVTQNSLKRVIVCQKEKKRSIRK